MQDKLFGRKVRRRSVGRLVAEMRWIADHIGRRHYCSRTTPWPSSPRPGSTSSPPGSRPPVCPTPPGAARLGRPDQQAAARRHGAGRAGRDRLRGRVRVPARARLLSEGDKVEDTERAFAVCREFGVGTHASSCWARPRRRGRTSRPPSAYRADPADFGLGLADHPRAGHRPVPSGRCDGALERQGTEDADYHFNRDPIRLEHLT